MSNSTPFWNHPVAKIEEALSLRKQIDALQDKLSGLFGSDEDSKGTQKAPKQQKSGSRRVSAATLAKMRAAQQARWSKIKGLDANSAPDSRPAPANKAKKKRGGLTPEGRAKLSAAMKARWEAKKAA